MHEDLLVSIPKVSISVLCWRFSWIQRWV